MGRIVRLINVSDSNNNKFYHMTETADGTQFDAHYGRVGAAGVHETYPITMWDKKYREKIGKKGYRDVTELVSTAKANPDAPDEIVMEGATPSVINLVNFLQSCAKGTIKKNYTIAVADVTQKQVNAAQEILDTLIGLSKLSTLNQSTINKELLSMYQVIPRKMSHTKYFLLQDGDDNRKFQTLLSNEQDLLDIMRGQVATFNNTPTASKSSTLNLGNLGLSILDATADMIAEIKKVTDLDFSKVGKIFHVQHSEHYQKFTSAAISNEHLLYHGSRNENWWSIINSGLKIRPSNAIRTGSMLGDGTYFANKARKSIGYTSSRGSYWAGGSSNVAYLALYQVNLGKTWDIIGPNKRYESWMSNLDKVKVNAKGYDSLYARGGADLMNDEFVIFDDHRSTIKYLIELKT